MSNTKKKIFSMSLGEVRQIGDFYLHNNLLNYEETLKQIDGSGNIETISKDLAERTRETYRSENQKHIDRLKREAEKLVDMANSNLERTSRENGTAYSELNLDTLMDELQKIYEDISKIRSISIMNSLKDNLIKIRRQRDRKTAIPQSLSGTEAGVLLEKMRRDLILYSAQVIRDYNALETRYFPLLEKDDLSNYMEGNVKTVKGEGFKTNFSKMIEKVKKQTRVSYKDIATFFSNVKGETLFANSLDGIMGDSFEKHIPALGLERFADFFGAQIFDSSFEGDKYKEDVVIDFSMTFDDRELGVSVKHFDSAYDGDYDTGNNVEDFLRPLSESDRNLFLYLRHNHEFFGNVPAGLLKAEEDLIMGAMLIRIFDAFYVEAQKGKFVPFQLKRQSKIDTTKSLSTHIWMTKSNLYWTHDMLEFILTKLGDMRAKGQAFRMSFSKEKRRVPGKGISDSSAAKSLQEKKDALDKGRITYLGIASNLRGSMEDIIREYNMNMPFFSRVKFTISFDKMKEGINTMRRS